MGKKVEHEEQGESAPLWIISFADLVTLLMSFFVILAVKPEGNGAITDPAFAEVAAAIRAAFKHIPPVDTDSRTDDFNELIKKVMALINKEGALNRGDSDEKGARGRSFRVRRLRDGMEITIGGPVMFEPFAAKPTAEGQTQLQQIIEIVKGHRNVVEIRGHAAEEPLPADWTYADMMKLSYARAEFVAEQLIHAGADPRQLRLVAVGANEPIARGVYDQAQRGDNRRVEIIVRESLIDDYVGQKPAEPAVPATGTPETLHKEVSHPQSAHKETTHKEEPKAKH